MDPTSEHAMDDSIKDLTGLDAEVVSVCRDLIRFDTSNFGGRPDAANERPAADYVMASLQEVGYSPMLYESAPGRANVIL
ncbi:MAG: hypothetical protein ACTII3_12810, partial [Galactobacter sp.]